MVNISATSSANQYRVQGTVVSVDELAKSKSGVARKMTETEVNAFKSLDDEFRKSDLSVQSQLDLNPDSIYGQVLVDGKVFATVYESGGAEMLGDIPGLSSEGSGVELAQSRLQEIAKKVHGEIKNSDFLPTSSGVYSQGTGTSDSIEAAQRKVDDVLQAMSAKF